MWCCDLHHNKRQEGNVTHITTAGRKERKKDGREEEGNKESRKEGRKERGTQSEGRKKERKKLRKE